MSFSIIRANGSSLSLDVAPAETYDHQLDITSHPVEDGVEITDHIQRRPRSITVTGLVTETPLGGNTGGIGRVLNARAFLEAIEGEIVDLVTDRYGTLTGYALQSWPHQVRDLQDMPITLTFREIRTATIQSVTIPPEVPIDSARTGMESEQDLGPQATEDMSQTDPERDTRLKSIAATGVDAVSGWFR